MGACPPRETNTPQKIAASPPRGANTPLTREAFPPLMRGNSHTFQGLGHKSATEFAIRAQVGRSFSSSFISALPPSPSSLVLSSASLNFLSAPSAERLS